MTPASIGPKSVLPPKVIPAASPYSETQQATKPVSDPGAIWADDEAIVESDPRPRPEVDMAVYQRVTSEDIFLGMGTKDPGTTSADGLRLTIKLPKENNVKDIELDVRPEEVILSSPNYLLHERVPRPVDPKSASAKWDGSKHELTVRVAVKEGEFDFLRQT